MNASETKSIGRNWWSSIFTDIHFWVPAVVLIAGLLLLQWLR
jgi:hypothetical protein